MDSYVSLERIAEERCQRESVIVLVNNELRPHALAHLNDVYQTYNTWITYGSSNGRVEIQSFYHRILYLVGHNDLDKTNRKYLKAADLEFLVLPFLELTKHHSFEVSKGSIFESEESQFPISVSLTSKQGYSRTPYQKLLKLSQSYRISVNSEEMHYQELLDRDDGLKVKEQFLNKGKIYKAIEYEQLLYLPDSHSLNLRE